MLTSWNTVKGSGFKKLKVESGKWKVESGK